MKSRVSRVSIVLLIALSCSLIAGLAFPMIVGAGDNASILYTDPGEIDADPGETVSFDLVVRSHGDYTGDGIHELSFALEYDPDVFTVTDVEHGPMLADGDSNATVDGTVEIDDENGKVTVNQERTPSGDGAKATETAATVEVAVAEDAPSTTETIGIADAEAILVSDYPQPSVERNATVLVAGGDSAEQNDDSIAGFTLPLTLAGIGALLVLWSRRIGSQP
ncbi:cohesin domain-containing protein [Natronorubrum halophilum]|uniref:cohesin domain-containing protein n=1 Tax=Natronorubrum halophilum TaxID=1702106 RepID=UPI000EF7105B|nr:cohesin domain-containing protein [Natronorubrum halophilum]